MKRTCGCIYEHPWPVKCARARELEADLSRAIRAKDWPKIRDLGDQLILAHRPGAKVAKPTASKEAIE